MRKKIKIKLLLISLILILAILIRVTVGEPCRVPSASMEPTILAGDWLWIDKTTYGGRLPIRWADIPLINIFTWIPLLKKMDMENNWGYHRFISMRQPKENDIVVFNSPENEQVLLLKRISIIFHKNETIVINKNNYKIVKSIISQEGNKPDMEGDSIFINGIAISHYIPIQNYYYLLGDNESNSRDSRFWGCIPEKAIIGKIERVLFSKQDTKFSINRFLLKIK